MKPILLAAISVALFAPAGWAAAPLAEGFAQPPAGAKPWVYWYFMDGNLTREGMTADLEAMKQAGIGGAIFPGVDIDIPNSSRENKNYGNNLAPNL